LLLKFFEIKPTSHTDIKNIGTIDIQREINIQQSIYMSSFNHTHNVLIRI
jgi:hypothetical protein